MASSWLSSIFTDILSMATFKKFLLKPPPRFNKYVHLVAAHQTGRLYKTMKHFSIIYIYIYIYIHTHTHTHTHIWRLACIWQLRRKINIWINRIIFFLLLTTRLAIFMATAGNYRLPSQIFFSALSPPSTS